MSEDFYERSVNVHRHLHGKIEIACKMPVDRQDDLSLAYTPGVARQPRLDNTGEAG